MTEADTKCVNAHDLCWQGGPCPYCEVVCYRDDKGRFAPKIEDNKAEDARMAKKIDAYSEPDPNGGCLLWSRSLAKTGYGQVAFRGKVSLAHRVAFEVANGPIPDGLFVLHKCDVRACVNPSHLFLGTQAENMADMAAKGRSRNRDNRGDRHAMAKLNSAEVLVIAERLKSGESSAALGREFGVGRTAIVKIKLGESWSSVTGMKPKEAQA